MQSRGSLQQKSIPKCYAEQRVTVYIVKLNTQVFCKVEGHYLLQTSLHLLYCIQLHHGSPSMLVSVCITFLFLTCVCYLVQMYLMYCRLGKDILNITKQVLHKCSANQKCSNIFSDGYSKTAINLVTDYYYFIHLYYI